MRLRHPISLLMLLLLTAIPSQAQEQTNYFGKTMGGIEVEVQKVARAQAGYQPTTQKTEEQLADVTHCGILIGGENFNLLRVEVRGSSVREFQGTLSVSSQRTGRYGRNVTDRGVLWKRSLSLGIDERKTIQMLLPVSRLMDGHVYYRVVLHLGDEVPLEEDEAIWVGEAMVSDLGPKTWIVIGSSYKDFASSGAPPALMVDPSQRDRQLPDSALYLADCHGILLADGVGLEDGEVDTLVRAVRAGGTMIAFAPGREGYTPAVVEKLLGGRLSPPTFAGHFESYTRMLEQNSVARVEYMQPLPGSEETAAVAFAYPASFHHLVLEQGLHPGTVHRDFDEPRANAPSELREFYSSHRVVAYQVGLGVIILLDLDPRDAGTFARLAAHFPSQPPPWPERLISVLDLSQEYVFGIGALGGMLFLYVLAAGPLLFFYVRKRRPELLMPAGTVLAVIATILILGGLSLRRSVAPDMATVRLGYFGLDGQLALLESGVGVNTGSVAQHVKFYGDLGVSPQGDAMRTSPLVMTSTDAELALLNTGLPDWQTALLRVKEAPTGKRFTKRVRLQLDRQGRLVNRGTVPVKTGIVLLWKDFRKVLHIVPPLGVGERAMPVALEPGDQFKALDLEERELLVLEAIADGKFGITDADVFGYMYSGWHGKMPVATVLLESGALPEAASGTAGEDAYQIDLACCFVGPVEEVGK